MGKRKLQQQVKGLRQFGRDFISGLSRRDVERLFDEDATRAISVLAGSEDGDDSRTKRDLPWLLGRLRAFFLGLAFKLSPARRLLFALSLLVPFLGIFDFTAAIGPTQIKIDFSPLWFAFGVAGLTWLLALELVDQLEVRDELAVARQLQRELLPHEDPDLPGYRVAHSYRTANAIGGDYYDFLPLDDDRITLTVGDASGHGMAAGLLMAISNASLRTALDIDPAPLAVLSLLNRALCRTGGPRAFMTLFYAILEPRTGEMEYACAAHPYPILRRADGELIELGQGALPLGLRRDTTFVRDTVRLEPGDLLLLYSDGLPEAVGGPRDDAFGFERLKGLLRAPGEPQAVHDRILAAVEGHLQGKALADDLTLVVIARSPDALEVEEVEEKHGPDG